MSDIKNFIINKVSELINDNSIIVDSETALVGSDASLDSMKLVELCLSLEDEAEEMSFEFDWTSDAAMSKSRSIFRNVGSLIDEFTRQMEAAK